MQVKMFTIVKYLSLSYIDSKGGIMELREYIFRKNCTLVHMSKLLEITRQHLSKIVRKESRPSLRLARDIEKLTNGEVTVTELRQKVK